MSVLVLMLYQSVRATCNTTQINSTFDQFLFAFEETIHAMHMDQNRLIILMYDLFSRR